MVRIVLGGLVLLVGSIGVIVSTAADTDDTLRGLIPAGLLVVIGFLLLRSGWRAMAERQALANPLPMCQRCRKIGPTRFVAFYQNIGAVIMLFHKEVEGCVCRSCVHGLFWKFTSTNLLLGWWSVKSLVINPLFILNNFVYYAWGILGRPVRIRVPIPD